MMNYPSIFESYQEWHSSESFRPDTVGIDMTLVDSFLSRIECDATTVAVAPDLGQHVNYHMHRCNIIRYTDSSVWIVGHPEDIRYVLRNLK